MAFFLRQLTVFAGCLLLWSCNQTSEIPFPKDLSEHLQPDTVPLELTDPKPLHWDTLKQGAITPTVFHLDFHKMKGMAYDADGFKPLPEVPITSSFDMDALPSNPFDLNKVPAQPLKMKMRPLSNIQTSAKWGSAQRVTSAAIDMKEWPVIEGNAGVFFFKKDSSGILWFGSNNGLYRFDGVTVKNMVPGLSVSGMNIDKQGRIWFVTQQAQLSLINVLDLRNSTIGEAQLPSVVPLGQPLFMSKDGAFWLSTNQPTLLVIRIDPYKMSYQAIDKNNHLTSDRYYQVAEDNANNIWLTGKNGIDIINVKSNKIVSLNRTNGLSSDTLLAITKAPDGSMWASWSNGVDAIDMKNKSVAHFVFSRTLGDRAFKLFFDKKGQLWIGGLNNLRILNIKDNTYRSLSTNTGVGNTTVLDMMEDGYGNLYLTSINPNANPFPGTILIIGQYGKTVYPFGNIPIISATEDSREHLWIGTDKQLFIVDSARSTYWQIDSTTGLSNNMVQSVTSQNGEVVITTNYGYNVFNAERGELSRFGRKEGVIADTIYSVMPDVDGNLWISASTNGVYKINSSNNTVLHLKKEGGLNGNTAFQTVQLKNKNIWIITDSTPGFIDPSTQTIQLIKDFPEISNASEKIFFLDSHDRIWIGLSGNASPGGLFVIDIKEKTIRKFSTRDGLSENHAFSILEKNGNILVGTGRKINMIIPPELSSSRKWEVHVLKGSENLIKKSGSYASDAITRRGNYIWGDDGVRIIYGIAPDTSIAPIIISGIDLMAQTVDFRLKNDSISHDNNLDGLRWDSLSGPYYLPENLKLPYNKNVIQFHFSELGPVRSDTVKYAYILEGIDTKWTATTENRTQTYLNLAPGNYTFKVSSNSVSGGWSVPAVLSFTIRPPWYNTWWAYLIYAIVALSLLRMYIIFRSRKLQRENKILEEKVTQRTQELQKSYNNVEQLGKIGRKITSSLSVEKIIGTAYKNVNALMDAEIFGIGIYHSDREILDFPATYENGEHLPPYTNDLSDTNRFSAVCFNSGKEIIMGNVEEQYKNYIQQYLNPTAGQHAESLVYLPLSINEKKLGVITVQSFKKNAYSENHLNMLRNIANYTAIALENAESYSKLNESLVNLRETQSQLIQSEKMASLGELTAGIAHEIQNPLNFVNNFSDVNSELIAEMKEEIENGNFEEVKLLAEDILGNEQKINHHGRRADAIVKGMLQHSRNNSGQRELTDINAIADEYLRLSYHGLRAKDKSFNATMKTDFDESIGKVNIVPQDLGRVILNLFNNAFYAVTEKKKQNPENYEPAVSVSTSKNNGHVVVRIADNGNGIPKEIVDKIFQPFFTTKPTGQGTGLGLSLSYDIVRAHGGELHFQTKEGGGTEFVLEMPADS